MSEAGSRTVITFGTFDVFHVGHLRVIERAAALGDRLVVGVSADSLNLSKKGREPVFSQAERLAIVAALKPVDEVFVEESLELKRHYIEQYAADVLVMGDDWKGRFDEFEDVCEVVYLPRTPAISTTALIEKISSGDWLLPGPNLCAPDYLYPTTLSPGPQGSRASMPSAPQPP
jgi:choline-phosphate cytidylyltransferase